MRFPPDPVPGLRPQYPVEDCQLSLDQVLYFRCPLCPTSRSFPV